MQKWSIKNILKEVAITLLMIFVISVVLNYVRQPNINVEIPNIKVKLLNNQEIALNKKGQPLLLHFWATWCPACKLEAPNLESIKDEVRVITVAVNSGSSQDLRDFMEENGYSYRVVNDNDRKLANMFDVGVYPTTFIYDSNGTLQFAEVGYSTLLGLRARLALIK